VPALRVQAETRKAALLALAPRGASDLAARALDLGAGDALAGPFDAEELALRLRALVADARRAARQRAALRNGLRAAMVDPLTGLYNRRYALPQLARIAEAAQRAGHGCAVMVADLDHFKKVNDRHGHAAGDAVLVEVARRMRAALRPGDMAARLGGEEFLVVMGGLHGVEAECAARKLCGLVAARPVPLAGLPDGIPVTMSVGVALLTDRDPQAACPDRLLREADQALYGAKRRGRNMVTLGRPAA
ncbi:MAG: GGDEF domain-containing protein, partial [Paracoccaceae bacterium]